MFLSRSPEHLSSVSADMPGDFSLKALLERGLAYINQGSYAEGVALLTLAQELLSPTRKDLIRILDTILQHYTAYGRAQTQLQEASWHLAEAGEKLQAYAETLKTALPSLITDLDSTSFPPSFLATTSPPAGLHLSSVLNVSSHIPGLHVGFASARQPLNDNHTVVSTSELLVTCFGRFTIKHFEQAIMLCSNRSGQTILRYLIAQPGHRASVDTLVEILWPDDEREVARHKLQVAVSALRRSLINSSHGKLNGYIQCKDGVYQLNQEVSLRSDVDEFLLLYHAGRQSREGEMVIQYENACDLYSGPFLVEDIYADWSSRQRDYLCRVYLDMCGTLAEHFLGNCQFEDAVKWANTVLQENRTDEVAYQQLMRAYAAEGRRSEAVRQYQQCEHILRAELNIAPAPETADLLRTILDCSYKPQK